jgi:hypothetical protein
LEKEALAVFEELDGVVNLKRGNTDSVDWFSKIWYK